MTNGREVVVAAGVRTAIGDYGGSLKDFAPTDLAARCVKEALSRASVAKQRTCTCRVLRPSTLEYPRKCRR
jgi:acetyl-CoA acetyltransferase